MKQNAQLSSLPLQMLLYFDYYWAYLFFAIEILAYIYKGATPSTAKSARCASAPMLIDFHSFR